MGVCVCVCVRACVRVCAWVHACVSVGKSHRDKITARSTSGDR